MPLVRNILGVLLILARFTYFATFANGGEGEVGDPTALKRHRRKNSGQLSTRARDC